MPTIGERLSRLETKMENVEDDIHEIRKAIVPLSKTLDQVRGARVAAYFFLCALLVGAGFGLKEVIRFIMDFAKL